MWALACVCTVYVYKCCIFCFYFYFYRGPFPEHCFNSVSVWIWMCSKIFFRFACASRTLIRVYRQCQNTFSCLYQINRTIPCMNFFIYRKLTCIELVIVWSAYYARCVHAYWTHIVTIADIFFILFMYFQHRSSIVTYCYVSPYIVDNWSSKYCSNWQLLYAQSKLKLVTSRRVEKK